MEQDKKQSNKGCWLPIIVFIGGVMLIVSPLNPFYETKSIGGEDYLTNSSWLITMVLLGGLIWFIVKKFGSNGD